MRTLIIPDLHHRTDHADHWLATQRFDRVVFLGDYFDAFDDNASDARLTAVWLRERLENTSAVFLLGNHDVPYMFPDEPALECPGFTRSKAAAIREVLQRRHWQRFELAWQEQGWLLSHAGFSPIWIEKPSCARILARCGKAMKLAHRGKVDPVLGYGEQPHGLQRFGGPLWMPWEAFVPTSGLNQIVGHTSDTEIREKTGERSQNYCIDVGNASVAAILSEGRLEILELA